MNITGFKLVQISVFMMWMFSVGALVYLMMDVLLNKSLYDEKANKIDKRLIRLVFTLAASALLWSVHEKIG